MTRQPAAALPRILIIGDSISVGYMEPLAQLLAGQAEVVHNPGNAGDSACGLAHVDEWLGADRWDIIHFNHGLHDLKLVDGDGNAVSCDQQGLVNIPLDRYAANLEQIVRRLLPTGARVVFATTTPYPDSVTGPCRRPGQPARYNGVARQVMQRYRVAINDLYTFALPRLEQLQLPDNVHFSPEGSHALAQHTAQFLLDILQRGR